MINFYCKCVAVGLNGVNIFFLTKYEDRVKEKYLQGNTRVRKTVEDVIYNQDNML